MNYEVGDVGVNIKGRGSWNVTIGKGWFFTPFSFVDQQIWIICIEFVIDDNFLLLGFSQLRENFKNGVDESTERKKLLVLELIIINQGLTDKCLYQRYFFDHFVGMLLMNHSSMNRSYIFKITVTDKCN